MLELHSSERLLLSRAKAMQARRRAIAEAEAALPETVPRRGAAASDRTQGEKATEEAFVDPRDSPDIDASLPATDDPESNDDSAGGVAVELVPRRAGGRISLPPEEEVIIGINTLIQAQLEDFENFRGLAAVAAAAARDDDLENVGAPMQKGSVLRQGAWWRWLWPWSGTDKTSQGRGELEQQTTFDIEK